MSGYIVWEGLRTLDTIFAWSALITGYKMWWSRLRFCFRISESNLWLSFLRWGVVTQLKFNLLQICYTVVTHYALRGAQRLSCHGACPFLYHIKLTDCSI